MEKTMKRIPELISLLILVAIASYAQPSENLKGLNVDENKVALEGFDPVAYFKDNKALKGKSSIVAEYGGVKYRFATQPNKDLFLTSPTKYLPQYGGWCAYAMGAKGEKVEIDPETFKIVDGKLYLFYNRFFNNTLDAWNENEASLKTSADRNWSKLAKQ